MKQIDFDSEELDAATNWHGGQLSMLYAIASTGYLGRGTTRPRVDCDECDGYGWRGARVTEGPCGKCRGAYMTDDQWLAHLASNLESEASADAAYAREQGQYEDAIALDSIAAKCRDAIAKLGGVS